MEWRVQLLIPNSVAQRLAKILRSRGLTETGGMLMGEHVSSNEFRIVDFTTQNRGGTIFSFLRLPRFHVHSLARFFRSTSENYQKFNYLGEWHSHPNFSTQPSTADLVAMRALVNDATTGAQFAVLMIVRLDNDNVLQVGTYLFIPGDPAVYVIPLTLEADDEFAVSFEGQDDKTSLHRLSSKYVMQIVPGVMSDSIDRTDEVGQSKDGDR
jgi:integrative and conjugative element protein (TIGR02256 family)